MTPSESILFCAMTRQVADTHKIPGKELEANVAETIIERSIEVMESGCEGFSISEAEKQYYSKSAQELRSPRPTVAEMHLLAFCVMMWVASTASRTSDIPISVSLQKSPAVLDAYLSQILWNLAHLKQPMHFELSPTDREWIIRYCLQH